MNLFGFYFYIDSKVGILGKRKTEKKVRNKKIKRE